MATEVKFKFILPGKIFITKAIDEDIFTRYIKTDFMVYTSDFDYYDTPDWDLCENDYLLRVCTSGTMHAATLRCGKTDQTETPGLYKGHGWPAYFESVDTIVDEFIKRGAYSQFAEYARRGRLGVRFKSHRTRRRNNLYLPDMTRIDFSLDDGYFTIEDKTEAARHMSFTLSYGDVDMFMNYCRQVQQELGLTPDLTSTPQKALRLLRSR